MQRTQLGFRSLPLTLVLYKVLVCGWSLACGWCLAAAVAFGAEGANEDATVDSSRFESEIRPVLVQQCIGCHGASKQEGGLRLDSFAAMLQGGDSGAAVMPGTPDESLILEALRYESFEMPPDGPLPERTVKQFEQWIAAGAQWPEHAAPLREESSPIGLEDRQWWAFQPVVRHPPPPVADSHWPTNAIDQFVLARLEAQHMTPAPVAAPHVLVRRLYYDLLGLPPTPEELSKACAALQSDVDSAVTSKPQSSSSASRPAAAASTQSFSQISAWEGLVDQLLDDPRYGEHWARHWLDVVRYSESDGWNLDSYRPEIWRYRDYVVQAFNHDKPYPDFVREQLAGDEIEGDNPELRVAAGYLRLGIYEYNQRDARGHWNDVMNEITDVTGDVFLGMSFSCARCHDHKFDPLLQRDYFQLRAFFEPLIWRDDLDAATTEERKRYEQAHARWQQETQQVQDKIDAILEPYYERRWTSTVEKFPLDIQASYFKPVEERTSWDAQMSYLIGRQFWEEAGGPLKPMTSEDKTQLELLQKELAAWDEIKPQPLPQVMTVSNHAGAYSPTTIPADPDLQAIAPGFPSVLSQLDLPEFTETTAATTVGNRSRTSPSVTLVSHTNESIGNQPRRLQLAQWIGDERNPLTPRVIVNRIWQQHIGRGLVATSNDFGRVGSLPSHPDLLDWLTDEFMAQGWSIKKLHKQILTSSTWRQSAHHPQAAEYEMSDPGELLLWRAPIRRLQAEQLRDSMLAASGELLHELGGPSVAEPSPRRALYVKIFRNDLESFLSSFDRAGGLSSVAVRDSTTTPTQALLLVNGSYTLERADKMAQHLLTVPDLSVSEIIQRACLLTWGRPPLQEELDGCLQFVCSAEDAHGAQSTAAESTAAESTAAQASGTQQSEVDGQQLATAIDQQRWVDLCHVLLNSNEFLYVE